MVGNVRRLALMSPGLISLHPLNGVDSCYRSRNVVSSICRPAFEPMHALPARCKHSRMLRAVKVADPEIVPYSAMSRRLLRLARDPWRGPRIEKAINPFCRPIAPVWSLGCRGPAEVRRMSCGRPRAEYVAPSACGAPSGSDPIECTLHGSSRLLPRLQPLDLPPDCVLVGCHDARGRNQSGRRHRCRRVRMQTLSFSV